MSRTNPCPRCGAELAPGGALEGLCPRCLLDPGSAAPSEPGAADADLHDLEEIRARFPELDVEELLGRGGMGVVYRARQRRLDRAVALKLLAPELARDPAFAERFVREARALARLSHPHVVGVHDFGDRDGLFYLLLELVDGVGLRDVLRAGTLSPAQALELVPQICSGLQYAHEQGVVHRDVKPENLLLDRAGRVKIADFGLAKIVAPGADGELLTRSTQVMGTPHYMAPEQISAPLSVDHRADIYSLGVVLYEMLTGELPVGPFEPPARRLGLDARLDEVVLRTLEREPARRYQRASEVATDVEDVAGLRGAGGAGRAAAPLAGAGRWVADVPGGAPLVAALALVLGWAWGWFVRAEGLHAHLHAVSYPLAYVALRVARGWRADGDRRPWRGVLVALAGLTSVAVLTATSSLGASGNQLVLITLAALLAFGASFALDRWVHRGDPAAGLGVVVTMILATIVQAAQAPSHGREAYYFASGIGALLCTGPLVLLVPDLVAGRTGRGQLVALARAAGVGAVAAAFFFHDQLF